MATHPEVLLLSALLRTGDHKAFLASGVSTEMFHQHPEAGKWTIDYITRRGRAPSKSAFKAKFDDIRLVAVDDVEHFADEVRREHAQQALMATLDAVVEAISVGDQDKALRAMQLGMGEVAIRQAGVSTGIDAMMDWEDTYNVIASRVDRVAKMGTAGIPTGFPTLDEVTGGLQPGWFAVAAARLGQGKTWTGIRMGFAAAVAGYSCDYYSLEQSRHQIKMRFDNFASKLYGQQVFNSLDLSRGKGFDLRAYKKFVEQLKEQMGEGSFRIIDRSRGHITPALIGAAIEKNQPDFIVIDYLTLMGGRGEDWRATAAMSSEIQGLCQRYNTPILGLAQVNRLGVGKEPPNAESLSQADAIGQDADLLVTMARQSTHVMKLKIAKFRHGPDGITWFTKFSPGTGEYTEISGDDAEDLKERDREVD